MKTFILRYWRASDAPSAAQSVNFRAVTRMTAAMPYPYLLSDVKAWLKDCVRWTRTQSTTKIRLAIEVDHHAVGSISADREGDQAEIGYWLAPWMHGRGIMTAAVKRFVPKVFRAWPIERVIAKTFLYNPASGRVLEKAGFVKTALEERSIKKNGRWLDCNVYVRYRK